MLLWGAAAIGYVMAPLAWWERLLAAARRRFPCCRGPGHRRDRLRARRRSRSASSLSRPRVPAPPRGMSLCLAAAGIAVAIAASTFTLSWTHTVEKTLWEEEWRVQADRLVLDGGPYRRALAPAWSRRREARLVDGGLRLAAEPDAQPDDRAASRTRMPATGRLCAAGRCDTLGDWLGVDADPVTLAPAGRMQSIRRH